MMVQSGFNPISKEQSKSERKKQKKKKKEEQNDSDDGGEELDLSKELFPLSHYVGDPLELINQVFNTITGPKITAMLPPILKGTNLSELKRDCLHELSGMSKKRILCVINGQDMEGSSGSEEDEEEEIIESPIKEKSQHLSVKRPIPSKEAAAAALLKKIKQEPVSDDEVQERDPVTGKSVMELLELEMRARIIKTMLVKGDGKGVLTEEIVSEVISGGKTNSKGKSPIKQAHSENKKPMDDKENEQDKDDDDDDDVKIVESPDEKRSDRRHRRRRRRHGSSSKHDNRSNSNRKRSKSARSEERGSRSKHKNSEMLKEDAEGDKKKKKITRKEFEERMKRAKLNRKYRQRREGSEEELNEEEKENGENNKKDNENETEETKTVGEEDGAEKDVSEKEEGEWDSNEEEEGQCSTTPSSSYYSDYSEPGKSRGSYRKKSLSRSRSRSRSYSPHRSSSCERKSSRRVPRVPIKTVPVGTVRMPQDEKEQKSGKLLSENKISTTQTKKKEEEEDNWGQKCDIEFVDSEEDFDGENNGSNVPKKLGISFSVKKKVVPNINQKDIDDLPMKKRNPFDDIPDKKKDDQILIISDSEVESKQTSNKNVKKLTGETHIESTLSNSVIIIHDDINPVIDCKIGSKENIATEETLEEKSMSKAKENDESGQKTSKICSDELNLKRNIDNEKLGLQCEGITEEISSNTKNISEDTDVHKKIVIPDEELINENNVKFEKNKHVESENTETINVSDEKDKNIQKSSARISVENQFENEDNKIINISSDEDKKIQKSNENISENGSKKNVKNQKKLTNESNKTKKVAEDEIINDNPELRPTRRRTRASKKNELKQKSQETKEIVNISDIEKAKEKQDKERKLALENEKRILEFENEFEEAKDMNNSEDNKSNSCKKSEETHISQTDENKDSKEIISKLNVHEHPSEENSETKTTTTVQNIENVKEIDIPKDTEESFKEFDSRSDCQESSAKSSKDIQQTSKSSTDEVYQPEECSKLQFGVSALDLTIGKNKEDILSNQVTSEIAGEVSNFYHPDTSASNSVQDFSLHATRIHDIDDEEEIDVVGGVEDEEIDVVGVDDDNGDCLADENATTSGMAQFVATQNYATDQELQSEIKMTTDQNSESDKHMSIIRDKTVIHESKKSEESPGDFYRGIDEITFSDEEKVQDEVDIEQLRNSHVEPIRIDTGLIRKKVPPKQKKDEMQYPEKSWSKDKKRKEKTKDTLVSESMGSLCSILPREITSKSELMEEEESNQIPEVTRKEFNSDDECSQGSSKCLSEASKIMPEDESESRSSTQSKGATKEMEIIGEIEATTADNEEIDLGRSSWSMRWLQSEKVQKVVSSSKMLSRVRKKIQQKDKATKVTAKQNETEQENPKPKEPAASNAVIGSIEEYERLFGKKMNTEDINNKIEDNHAATATPAIATESTDPSDPSARSLPDITSGTALTCTTNPSQTSAIQHTASKVPIIDSDSEGDSEEEALWSKIMGK